jgi:hypothetical protein
MNCFVVVVVMSRTLSFTHGGILNEHLTRIKKRRERLAYGSSEYVVGFLFGAGVNRGGLHCTQLKAQAILELNQSPDTIFCTGFFFLFKGLQHHLYH